MSVLDNLSDQMFQPLSNEEQTALIGGITLTGTLSWTATLYVIPDPDADYFTDIDSSDN